MDPRIFWKIIVDVDENSHIRVGKEIAIWKLDGRVWRRPVWAYFQAGDSSGLLTYAQKDLSVICGAIHFNGNKYLEVVDRGLAKQLQWLGIQLSSGADGSPDRLDDSQTPEITTQSSDPIVITPGGEEGTLSESEMAGLEETPFDCRLVYIFISQWNKMSQEQHYNVREAIGNANSWKDDLESGIAALQELGFDLSELEGEEELRNFIDIIVRQPQFCQENGETRYLGENVRIDAVLAKELTNLPVDGPVFHYPQFPKEESTVGVLLTEKGDHTLEWRITAQDYDSSEFQLTNKHLLTVNQDFNCDTDQYYFRMLVDAVPLLPTPDNTTAGHSFSVGEVRFQIGFDPRNENIFRGRIWRIVFDPNSSCIACT